MAFVMFLTRIQTTGSVYDTSAVALQAKYFVDQILEATHGTLLRKSNPADPVGALPMELVLNIMLYLDFKTVV